MATEHNQEAQDLGQEQADSQQRKLVETEQAEVSVEDSHKLKLPILKKA